MNAWSEQTARAPSSTWFRNQLQPLSQTLNCDQKENPWRYLYGVTPHISIHQESQCFLPAVVRKLFREEQVLKTWKEFSWQWNQEWLQTMGCGICCGCQADLKSGSSVTQQQSSRVTTSQPKWQQRANGTTFQICWLNCLPLHTIVFPRIIPSCKTAVNLSCISFTLQHPSSLWRERRQSQLCQARKNLSVSFKNCQDLNADQSGYEISLFRIVGARIKSWTDPNLLINPSDEKSFSEWPKKKVDQIFGVLFSEWQKRGFDQILLLSWLSGEAMHCIGSSSSSADSSSLPQNLSPKIVQKIVPGTFSPKRIVYGTLFFLALETLSLQLSIPLDLALSLNFSLSFWV